MIFIYFINGNFKFIKDFRKSFDSEEPIENHRKGDTKGIGKGKEQDGREIVNDPIRCGTESFDSELNS